MTPQDYSYSQMTPLDYSNSMITTRLQQGPPHTQWQVLFETQTTPKLSLVPDYSLAQPPPSGRCLLTHKLLPS